MPSSSNSEDTVEPGYSTVNVTTTTAQPPPLLQPVGMYQSINDPQLKPTVDKIKQDNLEHSSGTMSQQSSSSLLEPAAATMDTAVTYAHVDVDKKRASRRRKEGEEAEHAAQQQSEKAGPGASPSESDSWV